MFRSRHSCLEFRFRVGVRKLELHVLSRCVSVSRVRSAACSSVHVCFVVLHAVRVFIGCVHSCYVLSCVARSLCISLAVCFHVVMSYVNTWLMNILNSCSCPVLHMAGDFFGHVLVFLFCVSTWLLS